jgi:hypothetical protein
MSWSKLSPRLLVRAYHVLVAFFGERESGIGIGESQIKQRICICVGITEDMKNWVGARLESSFGPERRSQLDKDVNG